MNDQLIKNFSQQLFITPEQFKACIAIQDKIDLAKPTYYQKVSMTTDIVTILRTMPSCLLNVISDHSVQITQDLAEALRDYNSAVLLAEHENDEIYELGIDIETFSSVNLKDSGVYKYVEAEDFTILLFAYSVNNLPVVVVDFANGEELPLRIKKALTDAKVLKTAFNAAFERTCLSKYFCVAMPPEQWDCTMVKAARLGLPMPLSQCGAVLRLTQQKMSEGLSLINYFSKPCRATITNGGITRHLPQHAPDKWKTFKRYCKRDVEVEQAIRQKVSRLVVTDTEQRAWYLDQHINDRGVLVDMDFARSASSLDEEYRLRLSIEASQITGLSNPNSVQQLKPWIERTTGIKTTSLDKEAVKTLLPRITNKNVIRMLKIRQALSKTSTAKYKAMLSCACKDNRARGLLQFYGASRTGRFAGRLIQLQNLPQNHIKDLEYARELVKHGTIDDVEFEYINVQQLLSELIRTAFIASKGHYFIVCDYNAIEARVIAWLAGENWVLDVFRQGGDIYCATAGRMFHVPVEKEGVNAELRPKGKIAALALGFGGGVEALERMGGSKLGLTYQEEVDIVNGWRKANPHIVRLWKHAETACRTALTEEALPIERNITFERKWGGVSVTLPSKRQIFYPRMRINQSTDRLEYEGTTDKGVWGTVETYGGKLVENIVQSIARDCLVETMLRLDKAGYKIVFHVHDEVIIEATSEQKLEDVENIFSQAMPWAKDLPLKGAGYITRYYKK